MPNTCFESLSFVPFPTDENFINNENDPDVNFYIDVCTLDTQYIAPDKFQRKLKPFSKQSLSILRLNIRSLNKHFEAFKQFYLSLNFHFSIVYFQKHGLMISIKTLLFNYQITILNLRSDNQEKEEDYVSLCMTHLIMR